MRRRRPAVSWTVIHLAADPVRTETPYTWAVELDDGTFLRSIVGVDHDDLRDGRVEGGIDAFEQSIWYFGPVTSATTSPSIRADGRWDGSTSPGRPATRLPAGGDQVVDETMMVPLPAAVGDVSRGRLPR
jgi:hypothetical protein